MQYVFRTFPFLHSELLTVEHETGAHAFPSLLHWRSKAPIFDKHIAYVGDMHLVFCRSLLNILTSILITISGIKRGSKLKFVWSNCNTKWIYLRSIWMTIFLSISKAWRLWISSFLELFAHCAAVALHSSMLDHITFVYCAFEKKRANGLAAHWDW